MNVHHNIVSQIKQIAADVRAIDPDDDQLLADMIEAETDADELLDMLLDREGVFASYVEANKIRIKALQERNSLLEKRIETGRTAMARVLDAMQARKVERAEGTISFRRVPPKGIGDNADGLPDKLVTIERKPNKAAIKEALSNGADLPGWAMSNGGETISVRRK